MEKGDRMSDQAEVEAATAPTETPDNETSPTETVEYWKTMSRKNEERAKENKAAADELSKLRDAQKSVEERAAEREKAAEDRATKAEAKALRREVALESGLASADAALLDSITDEDAMRALAVRLAGKAEDKRKTNPVPGEGTNPRPAESEDRQLVRNLFG